jgi:hypothetical protein
LFYHPALLGAPHFDRPEPRGYAANPITRTSADTGKISSDAANQRAASGSDIDEENGSFKANKIVAIVSATAIITTALCLFMIVVRWVAGERDSKS